MAGRGRPRAGNKTDKQTEYNTKQKKASMERKKKLEEDKANGIVPEKVKYKTISKFYSVKEIKNMYEDKCTTENSKVLFKALIQLVESNLILRTQLEEYGSYYVNEMGSVKSTGIIKEIDVNIKNINNTIRNIEMLIPSNCEDDEDSSLESLTKPDGIDD